MDTWPNNAIITPKWRRDIVFKQRYYRAVCPLDAVEQIVTLWVIWDATTAEGVTIT